MGKFVKGDIVVIPFPFSDLSQSKKRPAMVLSDCSGDDIILCQITSRYFQDQYAIQVDSSDFIEGGLQQTSNIRPNKIFTADKKIILYRVGAISLEKQEQVKNILISIFNN